jgi:DNA-binding GntR family transcriptional regulator
MPSSIAKDGDKNLRERVRRALEAALAAGELEPGSLYSAPELGARLHVSATPVREAMLELSKDGLVVTERSRGFRVVEVSKHDVDQLSDIRVLLEIPSTIQVARSITSSSLDRLAQLTPEIVGAASERDLMGYLDLDRQFHVELISHLGNNRLTEFVDQVFRQLLLFALDPSVDSGQLVEVAEEHHALLEAMRAHDLLATEGLITCHIQHTRELRVGRAG